ncbi:MAG: hypothetical protein U1A78_19215 [Polyangia bacterium]
MSEPRLCLFCEKPLEEGRRKDAKYCPKGRCRGRAHRQRQAEQAAAQAQAPAPSAAAVLSCPCGRRFVLPALGGPGEAPTAGLALLAAPLGAEAVAQTVPNRSAPPAPISGPVTSPGPSRSEPIANGSAAGPRVELRTCELFFLDETGRRMRFSAAVRPAAGGGWRVRSHAQPQLGLTRSEGHGLGSTPGAWSTEFWACQPEDFGHALDLAVVYWDDEVQRPAVADGALLRAALGADWRANLCERVDGKAATPIR